MLCTPLSLFAQGYVAKHDGDEYEAAMNVTLPTMVDLFALFIVGAHLGVF